MTTGFLQPPALAMKSPSLSRRGLRLSAALAITALTVPCSTAAPENQPAKVTLTEDDFREGKPHRAQTVELPAKGKLVVTLGSNPTTGFSWGAKPVVKGESVLKQTGHKSIGPAKAIPGAGGSQQWTFEATGSGTTTLVFGYSRPWAGGEKDTWTLTLTVKAK